jgi:curved DNA-binding protein CbpA
LPRSSTAKQIKARFYELSKKHHPDVSPESAKLFTEINTAYGVLKEARSRRDYDRTLPAERGPIGSTASGFRMGSGLSRRRTQPMGTPPSSPYGPSASPYNTSGRAAGFGFGSRPTGDEQVKNPYFTYEEHRQRHSTFDERHRVRGEGARVDRPPDPPDNFTARFLGISAVVLFIMLATGGISKVRAEVLADYQRAERSRSKHVQEVDLSDALKQQDKAKQGRYQVDFFKKE